MPWREGSHVWGRMLECRDIIEHQIGWHPKMGSSRFWYENWTGLGALYFIVPPDFVIDDPINNVYEMVQDGVWDLDRLMEVLPEDYAVHIMENIKPPVPTKILDKPYCKLETRGELSVKSAWEYLRRRNEPTMAYSKM